MAIALLLLLTCSTLLQGATVPVTVSVDGSTVLPRSPRLWGHVNVSRRAPPPPELCPRIVAEYGRPEVTRAWLLLDQMWDYRTDTYRFDYEISRDHYVGDKRKIRCAKVGTPTGLRYYDYIDGVAKHSDAVLLNIRGYEPDVAKGLFSEDKWKEVFKAAVRHYKKRCPNLVYIEVLNEPSAKNQSNTGSVKKGYRFYRRAYQAINELNRELKPEKPLLVGGCGGFRTKDAVEVIKAYAADPATDKRLDFVSFHHYWVEKKPSQIAGWERSIDRALRKHALPTDLPIFVSEIGYAHNFKGRADRNLWHAAGMTTYQYFARQAPNLRLFPWVQYHSQKQIAYVQFDTEMRMTPYGAAVKMLTMHRTRELASTSTGLQKNGDGTASLVTADEQGITVQVWNLQPDGKTRAKVQLQLRKLPQPVNAGRLALRRYLIDTTHSNCFAVKGHAGGLDLVEERTIDGAAELDLTVDLEPMALCLWTLEPAE